MDLCRKDNRQHRRKRICALYTLLLYFLFVGCEAKPPQERTPEAAEVTEFGISEQRENETVTLSDIPEYDGFPYAIIHDNRPDFKDSDLTTDSFETYSELDALGRCGVAFANVGPDLMPTEERGEIGQIRPSGWHLVKYEGVDGNYLYNRCHLMGYQLTGENANVQNLITGTRYLNIEGMQPFENRIADYVQETGNHVLYRVTPLYDGNDLVARGVQMEGLSVEDGGEGISFHVFCYNVQPGLTIDYATGGSCLTEEKEGADAPDASQEAVAKQTYILNTNTHKFHWPSCSSVDDMADHNKKEYTGTREELIEKGYEPCRSCNP